LKKAAFHGTSEEKIVDSGQNFAAALFGDPGKSLIFFKVHVIL
jgi:hypothetical protein